MRSEPTTEKKRKRPGQYLGAGIAIGVAIGAAVENIGAGIAIGLAMGVAMDSYRRKKDIKEPDEDSAEKDKEK
ncbi:MAG: hypothetical protein HQ556_05005 [Candidatus Marinimicrobia bacterium]|nr:hypothetical protein [Candidatus Neomarinimicrobiota bacterium]